MDCPICTEPLSDGDLTFESYQACEEDHEESSVVFRLSCGHAYHTTCIIRAIRTSGNHCPVCRGTAGPTAQQPEWGGAEATMTFQNGNLQFQINVLPESLAEANEPENQNYMQHMENLSVLGQTRSRDPQVQRVRRQLNVVRDEYLSMEHFLIQERARILREALKGFRLTYKPAYDRVVRSLKRVIKKVRDTEKDAIVKSHGQEVSNRVIQHMDTTSSDYHWTYIARRTLDTVMEPSRKVFWIR